MGLRTASAVVELRGKKHWAESDARRVLGEWRRSGKSVTQFARESGLVPQRVYYWLERLDEQRSWSGSRSPEGASGFVPVTLRASLPSVSASTSRSGAVVVTQSGDRIEVSELTVASAAWVTTVARSLGEAVK
jgi:transposase-like protein